MTGRKEVGWESEELGLRSGFATCHPNTLSFIMLLNLCNRLWAMYWEEKGGWKCQVYKIICPQ